MMNVTMSAIVMMICMLMSMASVPVTSVNMMNNDEKVLYVSTIIFCLTIIIAIVRYYA